MFASLRCCLVLAVLTQQAHGLRRRSKTGCAPSPPAAADLEVYEALSRFAPEMPDTLENFDAASEGLDEGTSRAPLDDQVHNPLGFCPVKTRSERLEAANKAGGFSIGLSQNFDEFNAATMALGAPEPINPATDSRILDWGPIHTDWPLFDLLNGIFPTWAGIRQVGFLTMALPAFLTTNGGNRTTFFVDNAIASCWNPKPLAMGPMLFRHAEVAAGVADRRQQRGYYTGTVPQHIDFFHPEDLLFIDGDRHTKFRQLLELSGFARRYAVDAGYARRIPVSNGCDVPGKEEFSKHVGTLVQKAIWGSDPPAKVVAAMETYGKYGAFGIFGEVIHAVLGPVGIANKVKTSADEVGAWGRTTPFAGVFVKARDHMLASNQQFADDALLLNGLTVASLFAGLVGTMDMTQKCVEFQKQDVRHQELFQKDPEKYLIEVMRFDSAVTSVTDLMRVNTNMILEGRNITFAKGTPQQLILATANRDPAFWHRPSDFDPARSQLAETLSWNGRAADAEARDLKKAPRHCPGHCLSLKVGAAVCASMMGVFDELVGQGKILANNGEVKCNNFGQHNEPDLWTPP